MQLNRQKIAVFKIGISCHQFIKIHIRNPIVFYKIFLSPIQKYHDVLSLLLLATQLPNSSR